MHRRILRPSLSVVAALALTCGAALAATTPRDLSEVRIGERHARPEVLARAAAALRSGEAVQVLLWKLAWQYRKLAEAKKLLAAGRRRFEVTSQLQIT